MEITQCLLQVKLNMLDLTDGTRSIEITQCLLQVELNMLEITDGTRSIEIRQRLYAVCYKENIDHTSSSICKVKHFQHDQ
jgi:hypothetical protein